MGGMDTETLTGRDLDAAVARVLGLPESHVVERHMEVFTIGRQWLEPGDRWYHVPGEGRYRLPTYSAADCAGLAPVPAWLRENGPTAAQAQSMVAELMGDRRMMPLGRPLVKFIDADTDGWWAGYYAFGDDEKDYGVLEELAPTLPAAACRLMVAWAAKREGA